MELCVMIEGQEGVTWTQWKEIAAACEASAIPALFRSDHYLPLGAERRLPVLDAWATICGLAAVTDRLQLGSLVSPAGFRHPAQLAKVVATAQQISGGRIELGLGAGWNAEEHAAFGFPFPGASERMDAFAEQLEILRGLWADDDFAFHGSHYDVGPVTALPRHAGSVPIIVGGSALPKSVALAARWADEYNTYYATPDECRSRRTAVREAWTAAGRDAESARFSLMTGCIIGEDQAEVDARVARLAEVHGRAPETSWVVGTPDAATARLQELRSAGVDRVMLQLLLHDDVSQIALIGSELAPRVA